MTAPLSPEELARLRYTLVHEGDAPKHAEAPDMATALQMRRDGFDSVTVVQDGRPRCHISNGGQPRVDWEELGPRLLATLAVRDAEVAALRDALEWYAVCVRHLRLHGHAP